MNGGEESLTFVTLYVSKFVYTIIGSNADICSGDSSIGHQPKIQNYHSGSVDTGSKLCMGPSRSKVS
jgi:hypothetical protein